MRLKRRTGIMWGTQICSFICATSDWAVYADTVKALGCRTTRAQGLGAISSTMGNRSLLSCVSFINCKTLFFKNLYIIPSLHQNYRCTARNSQQHFCAVELFLATQPSFFFSSFAYDQLICMRMTFVAPVISSDNGQLAKRIWKHIP